MMLPQILSIFALSWFTFWPAIPAGLALGLSPFVVIATTTVSYSSGVVVVLLVGGKLREWLLKRLRIGSTLHPDSRIQRIWDRFGVIGLGLAAPMTIGSQTATVVGLALNADRRKLFVWTTIGALLWSIGLTVAVALGVLGIRSI